MKLKLSNLRIGTRIALALALMIIGPLLLSLGIIVNFWRTANDAERLRRMAEYAPTVSDVVHSVQKERSLAAGFIVSGDAAFADRLQAQYRETDESHAAAHRARSQLDLEHFTEGLGSRLATKIAIAEQAMEQIESWRRAVAQRAITADRLSALYSNAIDKKIDVVEEMLLLNTNPKLTQAIYAYTHLMLAKESASLERLAGTVGFAAGRFDQTSRAHLGILIDRQRLYLDEFEAAVSPGQAALIDAALAGPDAPELKRMRRILLENRSSGAMDGVSATQWFDAMSRRIDLLKNAEDKIASDLIAQSRDVEQSAWRAVWLFGVLTVIMLALAVALATAIARGIIIPLERITKAMSGLAARDGSGELESKDCGRSDEIGDMARAMFVFRQNLTHALQAEEHMKSEVRYRALIQASHEAIVTSDSEGNIAGWNQRAEEIFGYTEREAIGQSLTLLIPHRYRHQHLAGMQQVQSGGKPRITGKTVEVEGLRKDQSEFPMEISLAKWEVAEGSFITGSIRDITERKQTEHQLHLAAIAFGSQEGMMITDARKVILRTNQAFTQITGYKAEEAAGRTPSLLNSGHHDAAFYAAMWESIQRDGSWKGEIWNRSKSGEIYPEWLSITAVFNDAGQVTNYVGAFSDISQRKQAENKIEQLAFYDPLTGLPNRRLLLDRLQHALAASARNKRQGALLFIDLDNFKTLNDTRGHDKGDLLLKQVAQRLTTCVREGDTVARLGGDEFVIMLEDLSETMAEAATQTRMVGEKILAALNQRYDLMEVTQHHSTPSIGVTLFGDHRQSMDELLKQADLAMYQAKTAGRNTLRFFEPVMQAVVTARAALEAELREAVRTSEFPFHATQFILHYQAQMNSAGRLTGAEAVVRWQHPKRGMVWPADFISLAEETGLILPLGQWVVESACFQLAAWATWPETAHLTLAVNVSARQFHHIDFVDQVMAALDRSGADPQLLKLELTESVLVSDVESIIAKMTALKAMGVGFSLDDFGTGYSSLSYLKRLPLDQLKIDQSFVRDVLTDTNDAAIARTIITLGQSLGLAVIAEGVETEGQRDFLASHGCHAYQGYLFGHPAPAQDLPYVMTRYESATA